MIKQKLFTIVLIFILALFGSVGPSFAVPVEGLVDPGSNWASTLAGTAAYTFTNIIGNGDSSMVGLSLAFDGSIFDLSSTGIISSSVSSGWTVNTVGVGTYEFALLGGNPIQAGSSLTFSAGYSLLGSALASSVNPWDQIFGVVYAGSPYFSGGVTTVSTPEVSSVIFLGLAVASLALWSRKQGLIVTR